MREGGGLKDLCHGKGECVCVCVHACIGNGIFSSSNNNFIVELSNYWEKEEEDGKNYICRTTIFRLKCKGSKVVWNKSTISFIPVLQSLLHFLSDFV